ncbi:glutamine amidotransferase-related protein [Halomonas sp. V046]|uniref:glutamine amidotransferase-related protein n=1 Tax=Halomonas sp. V046 TaxID=3459611 RepID=UPI0040439564
MLIGLLQCDDVAPQLQLDHGNYPAMFAALLGGAATEQGETLQWQVWRCLDGDIPDDLEAVDAWLTTGSKFGVNDGLDWVVALEEFVRELYAAGKPLVGICFGHQLIGKALGGEVIKSPKGWGVGLSFNQITSREAWMEPWQDELDLLVSHQDQVVSLPPGGCALGGSGFCSHYLMRVGGCFLGVQGHPEFSREYSRDLMRLRREMVGDARVREGTATLTAKVDDNLMAHWMLNFMRQAMAARVR